jgi:hypothetical protein
MIIGDKAARRLRRHDSDKAQPHVAPGQILWRKRKRLFWLCCRRKPVPFLKRSLHDSIAQGAAVEEPRKVFQKMAHERF